MARMLWRGSKIAKVYDLLSEESEKPMREADSETGRSARRAHPRSRLRDGPLPGANCQGGWPKWEGAGHRHLRPDDGATQGLLQREGLADRAELKCGDAEQLPYEPNSLDGIFFSFTLELLDTPEIPKVLAECKRVLRPGGRIVVVAVSKEGPQGVLVSIFEWMHKHLPNLMDCRPIYVRRALEAAGFTIQEADVKSMWVPVSGREMKATSKTALESGEVWPGSLLAEIFFDFLFALAAYVETIIFARSARAYRRSARRRFGNAQQTGASARQMR